MKKVVKSKVAAQNWLWWSDNGKIFSSNNSGKFVLPPPTGNRHQNLLELLLLKNFAIIRPPQPLLGRHLLFHNFFMLLFCMGRTFFYSLAVFV